MSFPALERRLARLERRQRRWSACASAALVVLFFGAFAVRRDEVVAASRFELVDEEGRVRAELAIDADGAAGLFLLDGEGGLRATVAHDGAQSGLFLFDAAGTIRVGAAQYAHGGGGFALHGADSQGAPCST